MSLRSELNGLVAQGIRVGAVLGASETFDTEVPLAPEQATVSERPQSIGNLAQRWAGIFAVSDTPAVVRVRSLRAPLCDAGLATPVHLEAFRGSPHQAMLAIAQAANPELAGLPPPGLVGSLSSESTTTDLLVNPGVALDLGTTTVEGALDQLVQERDGLGWWAAEECNPNGTCACRLGLVTAHGILMTFYDVSPRAGRTRRP